MLLAHVDHFLVSISVKARVKAGKSRIEDYNELIDRETKQATKSSSTSARLV